MNLCFEFQQLKDSNSCHFTKRFLHYISLYHHFLVITFNQGLFSKRFEVLSGVDFIWGGWKEPGYSFIFLPDFPLNNLKFQAFLILDSLEKYHGFVPRCWINDYNALIKIKLKTVASKISGCCEW